VRGIWALRPGADSDCSRVAFRRVRVGRVERAEMQQGFRRFALQLQYPGQSRFFRLMIVSESPYSTKRVVVALQYCKGSLALNIPYTPL